MYRGVIRNPSVSITARQVGVLALPTSPNTMQLGYISKFGLQAASASVLATSAAVDSRAAAERASTSRMPGDSTVAGVRSAYIHLPFCKRKCFYCDFPVEAVGRDTTSPKVEARMRAYVDTVLREMKTTKRLGTGTLRTVFFGGGTPSLLPPSLLELLLNALDVRFGLAPDAEVSVEADPGTFDVQRLRQYRQLGVTRLSIGVQAFQNELLEACGRGHDLPDVVAAVEAVQAAGMPSWSLDLISGLPGLTAEAWRYSLQRAVEAAPDHLSVYDLQVSNYARPGHRCAHNQVYWRGLPYYAFGLGAASYLAGRRFSRPARMREYTAWVDTLSANGGDTLPGGYLPEESQEELLLDTIMLRLRTADGLDLAQLRSRFGTEALATALRALAPHEQRGTVLALDGQGRPCSSAEAAMNAAQEAATTPMPPLDAIPPAAGLGRGQVDYQQPGGGPRVRLSDPQGFLLSNDIISDVFAAFDITKATDYKGTV
ncbi:hypothetical protein VaNZ11_013457 [Volvox africanus]|uniref:Radical SAM core domain-containing protein n=1 Tax=Volvox africanus TaxID=51714 RepID=A0ABQ5SH11_9CHLO|nr:hypothetical protein VaNZ11_013457 [Volvox africanus]